MKARWVAALRSGKYEQGQGRLRDVLPDGQVKFCCLGVLCEISDLGDWRENGDYDAGRDSSHVWPPAPVANWAGLDAVNPVVRISERDTIGLSRLNDRAVPFTEIADLIEGQL